MKLKENKHLKLNELIEVLKPDYQRINEDNNWVKEETIKQILEVTKLFTGGNTDGLIH